LRWLLLLLIALLVMVPPLGYVVAAHVPEPLVPYVALPMALQIDLAADMFGHRLFPLNEFTGPYPAGVAGWATIAAFWLATALAIWIIARYLLSLRTRHI
jgi:hypothetical protein